MRTLTAFMMVAKEADMDNKKPTLEELYQQENIFPVKKIAIPMLKGFQNGKPVFEDKPYICYDIDMEPKQKALARE